MNKKTSQNHLKNSLGAGTILAVLCAANAQAQPNQPPPPPGSMAPASTLDTRPHVTLAKGTLSARVWLPVENGFYRGTRFDHAGIVTHTSYKGQLYADYWFSHVSSSVHDYAYDANTMVVAHDCCAVSGPAEEFDDIGYDDAKPGESFLKVGVGMLKRDTGKYDHALTYPITNAGKRTTMPSKDSVRFTQVLSDKSGYGYDYVKTVRLVSGSQMTIAHTLKNTGTRAITTAVYAHNFLTFAPGNDGIELTAPFILKPGKPLDPKLAKVDGKSLRYVAAMTGRDMVASPFTGFGATAADFDFRVTATKSGFGQRIRADQPISRINMWSVRTNFSWEPYIAISLKPGESKSWTYTYDFFGPGDK